MFLSNRVTIMHDGVRKKLDEMSRRFDEIEAQMSDPEFIADRPRYMACVRERGGLVKTVGKYRKLLDVEKQIAEAKQMMEENGEDKELVQLAREELVSLEEEQSRKTAEIIELVATHDEDSSRNVIVEIRAGTGGEEAALFAANLMRMYLRYAEKRGWRSEVMNASESGMGGYKEVTFGLEGENVYGHMHFESGTHRVQRVPKTETQGRIHTSACTVAVLPEAEEVEINISRNDIEIECCHSSGPGGQHVNKTQSAVRITHISTGIMVYCQDEKSQHKNKASAMRVLRSRLYDHTKRQLDEERGRMRRSQIGSGDRSERIRTYNFPQNRVTDHRINLTLYDLGGIMEGNMDRVIDALVQHHKEESLKSL